ncbi:MAG: hypothetical protein U0V70_17590 [Terriglobia bacterium]
MTRGAANDEKQLLSLTGLLSDDAPRRRTQELHEIVEIVDAPETRARVGKILQARDWVKAGFLAIAAGARFIGK